MSLERIGPYTIQGILGRGGMGTVYRGVHLETNSLDAIKVLSPQFAEDDHFRGRFESEIKALLKLNHHNIVKLLSYGQEDGMLFFSMELVSGNSLFDMQKRRHEFDWRQVIAIAKDCAHGLRHAHDRGIIHRDLKPGNLLMACTEDGKPDHVKLTDFGIAKRFGNSQNTGTNILGTMDFMSPEQAKGEPVTFRSDLYSLGTVMFTLLSGRPPFTSNSVEESLRNLTRVPAPRINSIKPGVPAELDALISRLMAKKPEDRVATAQALIHQLTEIEEYLREYSEAQTAQISDPRSPSTFDIQAPKTVPGTQVGTKVGETGLFAPIKDSKKSKEELDSTKVLTDLPIGLEPQAPNTNVDYFNTVTEQVRESQVLPEVEEPNRSTGTIWLTIALLAVLATGTFGVIRALRPPTAEQLFVSIEASEDQPNKVLEEIDQFLELYPDEPRAGDVAKMQKIGYAIRNYTSVTNRLVVRGRSPGGLSDIEKQFMEIADLASKQPDAALAKMAAFATFHNTRDKGLTESELACVQAAGNYKLKRDHELQSEVLFNLRQVREKLEYAASLEDKEKAIVIHQSILDLYSDVNWKLIDEAAEGRGLIRKSRYEIARLRQAIRDEKEAARLAEQEAADAAENDGSDGDDPSVNNQPESAAGK